MSKLCLTLVIASGLTMAIPTANTPTSARVARDAGAQVTNEEAFKTGVGSMNADLDDGVSGTDTFTCYTGGWENYPAKDKWVSFNSMFEANKGLMKSNCPNLGAEPNTDAQIENVHDAILEVSQAARIDPRFGLAIVMQESSGCVNVGTTNNGVTNPGIMQSHNGVSFVGNAASPEEQKSSITQMVVDGMQGTIHGDGLTQLINQYGNLYEAARAYNSGSIIKSNLNDGNGATANYVAEVANRLTGWVSAEKQECT